MIQLFLSVVVIFFILTRNVATQWQCLYSLHDVQVYRIKLYLTLSTRNN